LYLKDAFVQNFADFLRFAFPGAEEKFDLSRAAEFIDKELPPPELEREEAGGHRTADLLAKIGTKAGGEEWLLVHTEIEGGSRADLAWRVFRYWYRIRDRHARPVKTVVFFTGDKSQPKPSRYEEGDEDTDVRFRYRACDVLALPEEELMAMDNPFAIVVLACRASLLEGKIPDRELNAIRLRITKKMFAHGYGHERTKWFVYFLWNFLYTRDPEVCAEYKKEIGILTEGKIDMDTLEIAKRHGWEEGREEGMHLGMNLGVEKGRKETMDRVAKSLLELEISPDLVEKIRRELQN